MKPKTELAAEVWRRMFDFLMSSRSGREVILRRLGLTPGDAKALHSLTPGEGRPMGALAEEWTCDASNATWMVDRLEERGLVERRSMPTDRRVKMVVLTDRGVATKEELLRGMYEPPRELLALDRATLEALAGALAALPVTERPLVERHAPAADAHVPTESRRAG